jgi:hypothetical protein
MKNRNGWEDIPSLEGAGVDWGFKPTTPLGKRSFVRIKDEDIRKLFAVSEILVKVATANNTYTGELLDISTGGLALHLPVLLEVGQPLKVGFCIGIAKIISRAIVRHSSKEDKQYKTGVEFVNLDSESSGYINGLYASMVLHHAY